MMFPKPKPKQKKTYAGLKKSAFKKTKPKKRRKKSERQILEGKLDELFRLDIRAVGYCMAAGLDNVTCGGVLQTCHIVTRANRTLRWDDMNALCMCAGHHVYYTNNPELWRDFVANHFSEKWQYVEKNRNIKTNRTLVDLQEMINAWM